MENTVTRNFVIFDFEVFKHDTLFGAIVISKEEAITFQTWNLDEIRKFYLENVNSIWLGWNISGYDNFILEGIIKGFDEERVKALNDSIISGDRRRYLRLKLYYWDLMSQHYGSLKATEAYVGKNISETEIDFNLDRELTDEEKLKVESYNRDDLNQTFENFMFMKSEFDLRIDIIKEFGLSLDCLKMTGTQIAEEVLHAERIDGISTWVVKPTLYPQLQIKNKEVIDFYLKEKFATNEKLKVKLCGVEHTIGAGGIHGAINKYHSKEALYFDVSGYYNLVMINYNLLPRSIPQKYQQVYKDMYHEQLRLKKINPLKRSCYKTILLSVFGAMTNEYCKFYDPYHGRLVTMTGQLFLVDLLEKLEGKIFLIQSNTDGIIAEPLPGIEKQEIVDIINEWQQRTGFVLKLETIYNIHQRDVNCYFYTEENGFVHSLGEAVKDYGKWEQPFWKDSYKSKEPIIMSICICEYFLNGKLPEEVIKENENNLRLFQYICKKMSFDWLEYEENDIYTEECRLTKLQGVNRAFALKSDRIRGMIYKRKYTGKVTKSKVSNLPDNVFVYDNEILSPNVVNALKEKIDFDYYVGRAYERIAEFSDLPRIKEINLC